MPQAIGCGTSPASGASIRSTDSPEAVSPLRRRWRTRARRARRAGGRMAAAQCSRAARVGCVSKRMKSAPPSIRPSTCSTIISSTCCLVLRLRRAAGRSSRPRTPAGRPRRPPRGRVAPRPRSISPSLLGQAELGQRHAVGAEGVGRQHVGPGVAVLAVDRRISFGSERHSSSNERFVNVKRTRLPIKNCARILSNLWIYFPLPGW